MIFNYGLLKLPSQVIGLNNVIISSFIYIYSRQICLATSTVQPVMYIFIAYVSRFQQQNKWGGGGWRGSPLFFLPKINFFAVFFPPNLPFFSFLDGFFNWLLLLVVILFDILSYTYNSYVGEPLSAPNLCQTSQKNFWRLLLIMQNFVPKLSATYVYKQIKLSFIAKISLYASTSFQYYFFEISQICC